MAEARSRQADAWLLGLIIALPDNSPPSEKKEAHRRHHRSFWNRLSQRGWGGGSWCLQLHSPVLRSTEADLQGTHSSLLRESRDIIKWRREGGGVTAVGGGHLAPPTCLSVEKHLVD